LSFVQVEFLLFFAALWGACWAMPGRSAQNLALLVGSLVAYGWVHPWWSALLLVSALLDYSFGLLLVRAPGQRRLWMALSLMGNLGLLLWFKYLGFFVDNAVSALTALGLEAHRPTLSVLLPAGISFYTFQTLSYTLDVYRGQLKPRTSLLDYLLFVSFFPQLVAGPIERASRLLPQFERCRRFNLQDQLAGLRLILWGAFQKLVIADTLAPYVDGIFALERPGPALVWAGTAAFCLQLFADFSGYTDLARGTARCLGVDLSPNFREPYLAASPQEFWQRWHISLSTWIRDYLLLPLLGDPDRVSPLRFGLAVTATMAIMGLWHGAGWNFLAFGLLQAAAMGLWAVGRRAVPDGWASLPEARLLGAFFYFCTVGLLSGLLFREHDLSRVARQLTEIPWQASASEGAVVLYLLVLCAVLQAPIALRHALVHHLPAAWAASRWRWPAETTLWSLQLVCCLLAQRPAQEDFLYFQF
jgi:D-alanyl-lipoteichoic acid acyltransferase DltB (MBOAT superfamily)